MGLTNEQLASLRKLQQGELDAVLLYRRLAEMAKSESDKTTLKKIAADEGRHAAIARKYTGLTLTPRTRLATIGAAIARVIGLRATLRLMAKAENAAGGTLAPMLEFCPEISEVIADEKEHGRLLGELTA